VCAEEEPCTLVANAFAINPKTSKQSNLELKLKLIYSNRNKYKRENNLSCKRLIFVTK